ncbi:MAG: acyltransferase [Bacteroidales bacterium]|nr:acyltransferase [Bacteroidales bacterium]
MNPKVMNVGGRLEFVDIAKAFLIVLVVVGHFNPTVSNSVWDGMVKVIYSFHMPAFMFLSGLLYVYTSRPEGYGHFVWRKVRRLMVPYLTASVCIIAMKLVMQCVMTVKNEVDGSALLEIFWHPKAAYHLWFVWVLLLMFLVVGVSSKKWYRVVVGVLAVVLWFVPIHLPSVFCVSHLKGMAVFFMAGVWSQDSGMVRTMQEKVGRRATWCWIWVVGLTFVFVVLESMLLVGIGNSVGGFCVHRVLPFVGIGLLMFLSLLTSSVADGRVGRRLVYVGGMSFLVYLFHTCFSELAKVVLAAAGITEANYFVPCAFLVCLAGFSFPLLFGKWVVSRSECLSFLLGQSYHKQGKRA